MPNKIDDKGRILDKELLGPDGKGFSIEQAGNFLNAKKKTIKDDIKKEAAKQDISITNEGSRKGYLLHCISYLQDVDGDLVRCLPQAIRETYSTKDIAFVLRKFLEFKSQHVTDETIAKQFGIHINAVRAFEKVAIEACRRSIDKSQKSGIIIPVVR